MRTIELDASGWKTPIDFLSALRAAIGAPEEHGWNPDAFIDSMVWGGMNSVQPPYTIQIVGAAYVPKEVTEYIFLISSAIKRGREDHCRRRGSDVDVSLLAPARSD
jgi:hypothetical protein